MLTMVRAFHHCRTFCPEIWTSCAPTHLHSIYTGKTWQFSCSWSSSFANNKRLRGPALQGLVPYNSGCWNLSELSIALGNAMLVMQLCVTGWLYHCRKNHSINKCCFLSYGSSSTAIPPTLRSWNASDDQFF